MLTCPFCGEPEADRIDLDGKRFIVFPCQFTPEIDPSWDDPRAAAELRATHATGGAAYFRGMCDRLHLYVTRGEGARTLQRPPRNQTTEPSA